MYKNGCLKEKVKVDKDLILKVAKNARLNLSDSEVNEFVKDFEDILSNFSSLDEVDVKDVKPSFQPISLTNVFREDVPSVSLSQEDALSNTPNKKDGLFKGPRAF